MTTDTPIPESVTCQRCGHVWRPQVPHPVRCARCSAPSWDRPRLKRGHDAMDTITKVMRAIGREELIDQSQEEVITMQSDTIDPTKFPNPPRFMRWQTRAILNLEPGQTIVLPHGDFKCGKTSCTLINKISDIRKTQPHKYMTAHTERGDLVVGCYDPSNLYTLVSEGE